MQAEDGVSLDAQRVKVQQYASLYDLELVDVVVDAGASAKTLTALAAAGAGCMPDSGDADACWWSSWTG